MSTMHSKAAAGQVRVNLLKSKSWKNVAELVGIGAIVGSLVLLAYEILQKYNEGGLESLTAIERARFALVAHATKTRMDAYYYQYQIGLLDDEWYTYRFEPSVRHWRDRWEDIGALSEENTRTEFRDAVEAVPD